MAPINIKYNIPTLMALCQGTEVACNWTGHAKECKILRRGQTQRTIPREPSSKRFNAKHASSRLVQLSRHSSKQHNRPITSKRKMSTTPFKAATDAGFARFLKEHCSPKHQRVTAGGRIVPMDTSGNLARVENTHEESKALSKSQHSPIQQISFAKTTNKDYPQVGMNTMNSAVAFLSSGQAQQGGLHPAPMNTAQIPVSLPMPFQSFLSPFCPQESMDVYDGPQMAQQVDGDHFQALSMKPELNFHPAGVFRLKIDQMHNIANGIENATITEFKSNIRYLLDLVRRSTDSIRVEYMIYLHEQMEMVLEAASQQLHLVDADIAMRPVSSPSQVGQRIRWKRIRSEAFDSLEDIKLLLGETQERFSSIPSITDLVMRTLFHEGLPLGTVSLSPDPGTSHETTPQVEESFHQDKIESRECSTGQDSVVTINGDTTLPDFDAVFNQERRPQFSEPIEHPESEVPGRFDDMGSDLYGIGDDGSDTSARNLCAGDELKGDISRINSSMADQGERDLSSIHRDAASEDDSTCLFDSVCSDVPRNAGHTGDRIHEPPVHEEVDRIVESRTPRFLPRHMRRCDSQTVPRNFWRRFSSIRPLAAERCAIPQYFDSNWRSMGSASESDSLLDHDYEEGTVFEDYVGLSDREPSVANKYSRLKVEDIALDCQASYLDTPGSGTSDRSEACTRDAGYDASIDLIQGFNDNPKVACVAHQHERADPKAIRTELRAMQGIGHHGLPTGRPTVQTFDITANGLPGRFDDESGWMALALKKLFV